LPGGWTGKCNALQRGLEQADGEWLLFVDSDVVLQRDALSRCMSTAIARGYDAISLITALECPSFWERLLAPLAAGTWSVMNLVSLTNNDNRPTALANGQFFLIRREAHAAVGGHAAVRQEPAEDVQLMRLMKAASYKVRFFLGTHLAATRMHATLRQIIRGWARIYSTTSQRHSGRIAATLAFFIVSALSVYPALLIGATHRSTILLSLSVAHLLLMTGYLWMIYRLSGNRGRYSLLFVISGIVMLWIFVKALWMCRTGKMNWRGTRFVYVPSSQ
jgi:cellulose synthase/poly-beta-1,6-N-acetylglucosamine synthase-like glycosyltransferase